MNQFPYDVVIFDLDGTLFDSEIPVVHTAKYTMEVINHTVPEGTDFRLLIGPPLRDSFPSLLAVPDSLLEEALRVFGEQFYSEGVKHYSVYPHIRKILNTLKHNGVYIALATAKDTPSATALLSDFGMLQYFSTIIGKDDKFSGLEKGEMIRRALPEKYRRACMVGDRKYDMDGALVAGIDGIGVEYGFAAENELIEAKATHIIPTTEALFDFLCPNASPIRGFFLTLEGPDGSGKSTQSEAIKSKLIQYGFDVLHTREPGGCAISEKIRNIILDVDNSEMCATCEALLYAASRAQHVKQVIIPAVEQGKVVLCDRFVDSSIAYQGGGRGLGVSVVKSINSPAVADMLPDATLYLSIDHKEALKRKLSSATPDRLEKETIAFHAKVQEAYEQLISEDPSRFMIVDATKDATSITQDAMNLILKKLN